MYVLYAVSGLVLVLHTHTHTYIHTHTHVLCMHTHTEVPGLNVPATSVNLSLGENGMNPMLTWRSVGG